MSDEFAQAKEPKFTMPATDIKPQHADGIYFGLPEEAYHADPALGSSGVRQLLQSPLAYWIDSPYNPDRFEKEDSDANTLGTFVHDQLLDRSKKFVVKPEGMSFTTKEGKAWRDAVPAGVTIIKPELYHASMMIMRALEQAGVAKHFSGGYPEVSFFWTEPGGFRNKIRIDYLKRDMAFDVKTLGNMMHKDVETLIAHAVATHRYHVSAYWYSWGIQRMLAMIQAKGEKAIVDTPATRDQHHDFIGGMLNSAAPFPLWFLFMETGGVPNITIRRFIERDPGTHEINAYWRAAANETERATTTFARYMKSHGPGRMWVDEATSKPFTDEEFSAARWILEEA